MHLHLLLTGDELMTGDIVDSNSALIARQLAPYGLTVARKVTLGDDLKLLAEEMRQLSAGADVLLVNGGLGPTVDDLTAAALAAAAGVELAEHPDALAHLEDWCRRLDIPLSPANRKQALLPAGCSILPNPLGSAVGFALSLGRCQVFCTPGVPRELERMLQESVLPVLANQRGADEVRKLTFFGIGESALQQLVNDHIPDWPADVALGFRAGFPLTELKLTTRNGQAGQRVDALQERIIELAGEYLLGSGTVTPAAALLNLLQERGLKICLAESCTGGLIASQLTRIPGSSTVFEAGWVSYSNAMKTDLLGVSPALLEAHGAVSEPVVRAMARGALERSGADQVISVSGIAGPTGGSADKPTGTVWIAWGDADTLRSHRFLLSLPREDFQDLTATLALDLMRRHVLGIGVPPALFRERRRAPAPEPEPRLHSTPAH